MPQHILQQKIHIFIANFRHLVSACNDDCDFGIYEEEEDACLHSSYALFSVLNIELKVFGVVGKKVRGCLCTFMTTQQRAMPNAKA